MDDGAIATDATIANGALELAPLESVVITLRAFPSVAALPHVITAVSAFVDCTLHVRTLRDALEMDAPRLLQRLVAAPKLSRSSTRRYPHFLSFHVRDAAVLAAERGDIETLELLCDVNSAAIGHDSVFAAAANNDHVRVLTWLHERYTCNQANVLNLTTDHVVASNYVSVVEWLVEHWPTAELDYVLAYAVYHGRFDIAQLLGAYVRPDVDVSALSMAVARGDIGMLQWLNGRANQLLPCDAFDHAASGGHMPMIEWIAEYRAFVRPTPATSNYAAKHGHLAVIQWLRTRKPHMLFSRDMNVAAEHGHLDIVQFLHENTTNGCSYRAMDGAAANGHLEVVKFLHEHYRHLGCSVRAMDGAAKNGHLDVIAFLHAHQTGDFTANAMDGAAANGHLSVVTFLHEQAGVRCTDHAMDSAAANGHLDVVTYLHGHRSEGCTMEAMNQAAANGHLDVVKFLHEHRREGCTTKAMDGAAANGHLDIVQWLHLNRTEGCTTKAMDGAAANGHLEIVQWLYANRTEGCTSVAMTQAAANGHVGTVQWLHANRVTQCVDRAMAAAVDRGYFTKLPFLFFLKDHAHASVRHATTTAANLHWLYERLPECCDLEHMRAMAIHHDQADVWEWLQEIGELASTAA